MNERIRELMKKAMVKTADMSRPGRKELDPEKFAELIVRECAQLVQGVPTDTMGYHTADQKIKEHFGLDK